MTERSLSPAAEPSGLVERIVRAAYRPVDAASLAAFRILFGTTMLVGVVRFMAYGWVDRFYIEPTFHFTYWGFDWVRAWPAWGMYLHFGALAVLAAFVTLGLFYRVAIALFFVLFTYAELIDVTYYLNHYYLVTLLAGLLCFLPANVLWSLDARRHPSIARQTVPAICLWALRLQVGVVYFYAGIAKLGPDWLLGAQPLNIWLSSRTDFPLLGRFFREPLMAYAMSWAGFLYDTTIVFWLSWRRTRVTAYLVLLGFHAMTKALFPIGMFPVIMTGAATVFFSPSWPRKIVALFGRGGSSLVSPPALAAKAPGRFQRLAVFGFAAYALVQVAMPLRHRLYGGDVLWHEQGMRWAWKVMVREKNGAVTFRVHVPGRDRPLFVSPRRYLNAVQIREMSGQPDLILQLAHHIARDFAERGQPGVGVSVDAIVSLNGRRSAPMIDPRVDLARVDDGIALARWILPAPETAPPMLSPRHPRGDALALGDLLR